MEPLDFFIGTSSFFIIFQKRNCTISFGLEEIFQKYSKLFNSQNFNLLGVRNWFLKAKYRVLKVKYI